MHIILTRRDIVCKRGTGKIERSKHQFAAHLPPLLCKAPRFCALLFGELAMLGSSLCESRKAVLGPWSGGGPAMELTAAHRESSGTLAGRTPARSWPRTSDPASLGRRAMVWDWLSLCSTIIGLWGFIIPHIGWLWLGMRDLVHGPRTEQNQPIPTVSRQRYKQDVGPRSIVR